MIASIPVSTLHRSSGLSNQSLRHSELFLFVLPCLHRSSSGSGHAVRSPAFSGQERMPNIVDEGVVSCLGAFFGWCSPPPENL